MRLCKLDRESTHVNTIQMQHRKYCGVTAGGAPGRGLKYFLNFQRFHQGVACIAAPIIEITRDNQGRVGRHQLLNAIFDQRNLFFAPMSEQAKMDVDAM